MKKRDAINFRCTTALRQRIRALRHEGENLTATITRLLEAGCRAEEAMRDIREAVSKYPHVFGGDD